MSFRSDDVAAQRAVGGQDHVVIGKGAGCRASDAGVVEHAQLRREARRLLLPVEDQRPRHHHQRRRHRGVPPARVGAAGLQQRQHLGGLAHAHVVGQAAAEGEAPQEVHPAQALALVIAQLPDETLRLRGGGDTLKLAEFLAARARRFRRTEPPAATPAGHPASLPGSAGSGCARSSGVPNPASMPIRFSHSSGSTP